MKMSIKSIAALSLLAVTTIVRADTEEDGRIWLNLNAQGALPIENLYWYAEVQPRWRDEGDEFDQRLLRPAVFHKLTPAASVWFGYANVLTHLETTGTTDEDRLWQQFTYNREAFGDVALQSRTRMEQRWLDTGDDVGHRLRQLFRMSKPIAARPSLSAIVWDEVFLNFNDTDWGAQSGFDQNRGFLGLGYAVTPRLRIEMGYLNQYVDGATADRLNHVFSTTVALTF
jgi:hypothetical protein